MRSFLLSLLLLKLFCDFSDIEENNNVKFPVNCQNVKSYEQLYSDCGLKDILPFNIFSIAMNGLGKMDMKNKEIITIIDLSKPSTSKRFFVIDLKNRKLVYNCLTAHGKNSGDNYAVSFSDKPGSLKSCLGFYKTAETYSGKHGYSLKLDGMEKNINMNARDREIVIHGASYVSEDFIKIHGRLGRSWGCPAIPSELSKDIIDKIKNGTCVFIYAKDETYLKNSEMINK